MHQAKRILQRIIVAYLDVKCPMSRKSEVMKSVGSRIAGTILVSAFWFAFIVLYLAFYADNFNLWQKTAVFLASGAIAGGIIAALWVKWALK
jgi:hypothetical protein